MEEVQDRRLYDSLGLNCMIEKIELTKKIKTKKPVSIGDVYICDFEIKVNGDYLNPDQVGDDILNRLKEQLCSQYFEGFNRIIPEGYEIIVRLSGSDNEVEKLINDYYRHMGVIAHYHFWQEDIEETFDETNFVLIVCDRSQFRKLFNKYWFSIGQEQRFEIFILPKADMLKIKKWSVRKEGYKKDMAIVDLSLLTIDNLENGFYFRITSNKKGEDFFRALSFDRIALKEENRR